MDTLPGTAQLLLWRNISCPTAQGTSSVRSSLKPASHPLKDTETLPTPGQGVGRRQAELLTCGSAWAALPGCGFASSFSVL